MNRIDRISAILIQLQSRRVVKAADIASRFNISLRTVYRDIRTLEEAGIPLVGEAGVGYSIMDGYRLPPVMFTREEAIAFLTAEKLMEKFSDPLSDEYYKSALYKIKSVLRGTEKDMLETMDGRIRVLNDRNRGAASSAANPLQVILSALEQRKVISIQYFANQSREKSERCVEPVGVYLAENYWYLIGYCRLREDYRNFRLDRIQEISLTTERYKAQHPNLQQFINFSAKERNLFTVVVRVQKNVLPFIESQKYYNGFISETQVGDLFELTFLTEWLEGFVRWYITFADRAEIITPPVLKERVMAIATDILKKI